MRARSGVRRRERGGALAVSIVLVLLCVAAAAAVITVARGWQSEAGADNGRERAFQLAESGVDWAVARVRASGGVLPAVDDQGVLGGVGAWRVQYGAGTANAADDDGDGFVDEADEGRFTTVFSTGTASGVQRSIRVMLRAPDVIVGLPGATVLNANAPILDLEGDAFVVDGNDHLADGTPDATRAARFAVTSPTPPGDVAAQVAWPGVDNLIGTGGTPSIGQAPLLDLGALIAQAQGAATVVLTPGAYSSAVHGTAALGRTEVVRCDGDLEFAGSACGAGILVVDGDLRVSGTFAWAGLVLVRGRCEFVAGGGDQRIVGALVVGEELAVEDDGVTVGGTIGLLYSTEAVELASRALVIPSVVMWRETGTP